MDQLSLARRINIVDNADVVVTGGGLAGVAAALAAARAGASVILVERNGFLGGVATAGMCCSVFNCLFTRERKLLVEGIPLEVVDKLAVDAGGPGMSWRNHKGHIIYDVEKAKLVLAELLEKEGVRVRLESPVSDVIREGNRVKALVTSGKNGLEAIGCKVLVDATGDCDAAVLAGADYCEKKKHDASYVFRMGNVDVDRFIDYFRHHPEDYPAKMDIEWSLEEALQQYDVNGTFLFPHGGGMQLSLLKNAVKNGDLPLAYGAYDTLDAMQLHLIRDTGVCHVITGNVPNDDLDAGSISKSINEGKRIAYLFADCMKKYMPGFEHSFVSATADDLGIRGSRTIVGETTFTEEMKQTPSRCADSVGVGIIERNEILYEAENAWPAQVFGNDVYEIPLSCLIPKNTENIVIGSGRGADSEPALLLRVMVTTMVVGQGAGVAAAVAAADETTIKQVNYAKVRQELIRQGVRLPHKEIF